MKNSRGECSAGSYSFSIYGPSKFSLSEIIRMLKGKTAMDLFKDFPKLKDKTYCGKHFRAPGYCIDTVCIDE